MLKILHDYELGTSTEFRNNKLEVKPDNSGNVQFEVTSIGLKGQVALPAPTDLSEINRKLQELETQLATEKAKVEALENREDLHASGLRLDNATNEVVLTVQGGTELRVGLGKFLQVVDPTAIYNDIKATILADVKAELLGEEITDFAGTRKGYLIKAA